MSYCRKSINYSHKFLEVGSEQFGLEPLNLSVLDGFVVQERVQLHCFVGSSAVLILACG